MGDLFVAGGSFVLDGPEGVPARWGEADRVIWAREESMILTGPPGVGKTTLFNQLVLSMIGLHDPWVLGMPVERAGKVLYLAADRPAQIARTFRRLCSEEHREQLDKGLVVLRGPPTLDLAKNSDELLRLCDAADAEVVFLDSLKDMTVGLTDDDIGAGINRAFQRVLASGRDIGVLHHQRKSGSLGAKPRQLEDVYGSAFITAGAGSVVLLWGKAGDEIVDFDHLKAPASPVGPFKVEHDHDRGFSKVLAGTDLFGMLLCFPAGLTLEEMARRTYGCDEPTGAERKRVERKLAGLEQRGKVEHIPQSKGEGVFTPACWKPILSVSDMPGFSVDVPVDNGLRGHSRGRPWMLRTENGPSERK